MAACLLKNRRDLVIFIVVVVYHKVTSELITPQMNDLQNILPLTALLSYCKLKAMTSCTESIYLMFGLSLFQLLSTFSSLIVFPMSHLMRCLKYGSVGFIIYL